jgi:pilus assembly protein TadC
MKKSNVHIPFMLVDPERIKKIKRVRGIARVASKVVPNLDSLLKKSDISLNSEEYTVSALISLIGYFIIFGGLLFSISNTIKGDLNEAVKMGFLGGFGIGIMFFFLIMMYPKNLVRKKSELVERYLIYALKDFLMQISAGHSVYNACVEIALANYGQVSIEFEKAAKKIQTRTSVEDALEMIAEDNESKYFKKVIWQIVNTIKAGASLKDSLASIINDLNESQKSKITNFANELNLWSLIYMLFAVAIPSIGITMMVILAGFGGADLQPASFVFFVIICSFIQFAIVGFIKARRPVVE